VVVRPDDPLLETGNAFPPLHAYRWPGLPIWLGGALEAGCIDILKCMLRSNKYIACRTEYFFIAILSRLTNASKIVYPPVNMTI
jgi:hypothetical protein